MERVYLTIRIERVATSIALLSWPQITDLVLWAGKRELLSLRIDEKASQIRQRAAHANAILSSEVRDTLARFAFSLESVSDKLHAPDIAKRKAEARSVLHGAIEADVCDEHNKILNRRLVIERRKEEAERVMMEEDKERARIRAIKAREEELEEKARLKAEAIKRDSDRATKEAKEEEAVAMRKLAQQMVEQRQNMKITKKKGWGATDGGAKKKVETDVEALAVKDRSELMREQKELIIDERTEFERRLVSMATRHDHLERARRQDERMYLARAWEESQAVDRATHAEHMKALEAQAKANRVHDVAEKTRFARIGEFVEDFSSSRMATRRTAHVAVVAAWREEQARRKAELVAQRKAELAAERAREQAIEQARREAEEEEARRIQEAAEAARKKAEAAEERKRVEEKQRARERELDEKAKREQLDRQAARMNERSAAGVRSWGEDDDDSLPEVKKAPPREKEERPAPSRPPNDERWEDRRLGGDRERAVVGGIRMHDDLHGAPPRGGDRWERTDPRTHDAPPRTSGFGDREQVRGGSGFERSSGGFDRGDPRSGWRDRDERPRVGSSVDRGDVRGGRRDGGPPPRSSLDRGDLRGRPRDPPRERGRFGNAPTGDRKW
jgi:translation initiation factor 3 subunit A